MSSVHVDLIEGNSGRLDVYGWAEKAAIIRVLGLAFTPGEDDLTALAVAAAESAGYTYASAHPSITGLYLLGDRPVRAISDKAVEIAVTYQRPTFQFDPNYTRIRGRISLVTEKTNKDAAGDDLYTEYKESSGRPYKRQHGSVDRGLPCVTFQFSRRVEDNPAPQACAVIGRRNSGTFQNDPAGIWLVTGYEFDSPDGGEHWDVSIETTANNGYWKQTIYYVMDNGQIPPNWDAEYNLGKTVKLVTVYGSTDFDVMDLPNVMGM